MKAATSYITPKADWKSWDYYHTQINVCAVSNPSLHFVSQHLTKPEHSNAQRIKIAVVMA